MSTVVGNSPETRAYLSYLLRLWQADDGEGPAWRASLESAANGTRLAFAGVEELFAYLDAEIALTGAQSEQTAKI